MRGLTFSEPQSFLGNKSANDIYDLIKDKNIFEEVIDLLMVDKYIPEEDKEALLELNIEEKREFIFNYVIGELGGNVSAVKILKKILELKPETPIVDRFKTCLMALNEYIKVGEQEVKKFGEVFTPLELVNEMLDTLPNEVWSNPNLKWLDSCSGMGNFPLVVIKRLMVGLKDWEKDSEKRYKHIIENMIYAGEIQPKNAFMYLYMVDPIDIYEVNLYCGSFLEEEFDNHMKNVWNVDRFDIILGNPPYNQTIDLKFLKKSHNISDKVLFVHPSTWLIDEKNIKKLFIETKELTKDTLKYIKLFNGNSIFGISLFVPCVITYFDTLNGNNGFIRMEDKINNKDIDYNNIMDINKYNKEEYQSIKGKLEEYCKLNGNLDDKKKLDSCYFVNVAGIRGNVEKDKNKSSMIKDDFYTFFPNKLTITTEKDPKKEYFGFDKFEEGENFIKYLKSKLPRFALSILKINQHLNRKEMSLTPWLDFSQEWSDEKLIKEFNITEKEWEFIDSVIPDYY